MRSELAIADCRMLYFSLRSAIGRKNLKAYWKKATRTPSVSVSSRTRPPPYQTIRARQAAVRSSTTG
jgi:hypothetical protein